MRHLSWKMLQRIGDYAADELSGEQYLQTQRLVLEDDQMRHVAEAYVRMVALLRTVGEQSPDPPEAIVQQAVVRALEAGRTAALSRKEASGSATDLQEEDE
jgi:hypothetical protein